MNRKETKDAKQIEHLDKLNAERKDTAQKRVAHAINILKHWTWTSSDRKDELDKDAAHAMNLLDAACQDMRWHCEWFGYNDDVCCLIDNACLSLGYVMADNDEGVELMKADVEEALVKLSKALATLIRWDDPDQDVSEV